MTSDLRSDIPAPTKSPRIRPALGGKFLYLETAQKIRQRIIDGAYPPGTKIPTQVKLCKEFMVGQITVRRAITKLVEEGLLSAYPGSGTYVTDRRSLEPRNGSGQIALIFEEAQGDFPLSDQIVETIRHHCKAEHLKLQFIEIPRGVTNKELFADLLPSNLAGAILSSPAQAHLLSLLLQRAVPYVLVQNDLYEDTSYCVSCNYALSALRTAMHLVQQGCTRLVLVTPDPSRYSAAQAILGFHLLEKFTANLSKKVSLQVAHADWPGHDIYDLLKQWLESDHSPDGIIFLNNDAMAEAALCGFQQAGRKVPEDVCLVGFGNSPIAVNEKLSSIDPHEEQIGSLALSVLQQLIEGKHPADHRLLVEPELILRHSSQRN